MNKLTIAFLSIICTAFVADSFALTTNPTKEIETLKARRAELDSYLESKNWDYEEITDTKLRKTVQKFCSKGCNRLSCARRAVLKACQSHCFIGELMHCLGQEIGSYEWLLKNMIPTIERRKQELEAHIKDKNFPGVGLANIADHRLRKFVQASCKMRCRGKECYGKAQMKTFCVTYCPQDVISPHCIGEFPQGQIQPWNEPLD